MEDSRPGTAIKCRRYWTSSTNDRALSEDLPTSVCLNRAFTLKGLTVVNGLPTWSAHGIEPTAIFSVARKQKETMYRHRPTCRRCSPGASMKKIPLNCLAIFRGQNLHWNLLSVN